MLPLFERYEGLARTFSYIGLGSYPTPLLRLSGLEQELRSGPIFLKNDGANGRVFGGNKVRKLEFILPEVLERGYRDVVTLGYAGSNHAAATAVYGSQVGLHVTSLLLAQPNAHYVRRNLRLGQAFGAHLRHCETPAGVVLPAVSRLTSSFLRTRHLAAWIPPGGSSLRGCLGYVAAAFELAEQIRSGIMPPPARIYVALGTMGTAAGLAAGLAAAGIDTHVIGVRVVDAHLASRRKLEAKIAALGHALTRAEPGFPAGSVPVSVDGDHFGSQYARFTEAGVSAVARCLATDGIVLDGTYTGKAMSALIDAEPHHRRPVLFWNTYDGRALGETVDTVDYRALPAHFHRYFTHPVQALDKEDPSVSPRPA